MIDVAIWSIRDQIATWIMNDRTLSQATPAGCILGSSLTVGVGMSKVFARQVRRSKARVIAAVIAAVVVLVLAGCTASHHAALHASTHPTAANPTAARSAMSVAKPRRTVTIYGVSFTLTGVTNFFVLNTCPELRKRSVLPAGLIATVNVIPREQPNCQSTWGQKIGHVALPATFLADVDIELVPAQSPMVQVFRPYAEAVPTLPAGSFEAAAPASITTQFVIGEPAKPSFAFWDSASQARLFVFGPHAAPIAAQIRATIKAASN